VRGTIAQQRPAQDASSARGTADACRIPPATPAVRRGKPRKAAVAHHRSNHVQHHVVGLQATRRPSCSALCAALSARPRALLVASQGFVSTDPTRAGRWHPPRHPPPSGGPCAGPVHAFRLWLRQIGDTSGTRLRVLDDSDSGSSVTLPPDPNGHSRDGPRGPQRRTVTRSTRPAPAS
jgi:hypothetical protein